MGVPFLNEGAERYLDISDGETYPEAPFGSLRHVHLRFFIAGDNIAV